MKTVLLTGSGGFIGKNLKKTLSEKYSLLTPRSFELNLCYEREVKEYFNKYDIDFIINCATVGGARGVEDKAATVEENLLMVDNLLKYKKEGSRIILFGSGAMYDKHRTLHKVKEEEIGENIPLDLYGKSKMLISEKTKDRNDCLCLNVFACYGYGEKETRFPSQAITQNLRHQKIEINQNVVFDYLFIEDLNKIIEFFIENKPRYNVINLTPTESITLKEIAELVNEISDFKSEILVKTKEMNFEYTGDNSRLREVIKGVNFTSYKSGLEKLFNYIKISNKV